jgi:hypothetical protein
VGELYFCLLNPFKYSPFPFPSHPPFCNSFQYPSFYLLPSHPMVCAVTDALLFSFPEFHRAVPLLQTCSTYEFVPNCACFCVYVWNYLQCMRENTWPLSFWSWLTSLNMKSASCNHSPSNHMSSFLMAE